MRSMVITHFIKYLIHSVNLQPRLLKLLVPKITISSPSRRIININQILIIPGSLRLVGFCVLPELALLHDIFVNILSKG